MASYTTSPSIHSEPHSGFLCSVLLCLSHSIFAPPGMIIGTHQRPGDLEVNVAKTKALTNMRSANKGITTGIVSPIEMSLDACVEYLAADEILEVTPSTFRMAKNPDAAKKGKAKK